MSASNESVSLKSQKFNNRSATTIILLYKSDDISKKSTYQNIIKILSSCMDSNLPLRLFSLTNI